MALELSPRALRVWGLAVLAGMFCRDAMALERRVNTWLVCGTFPCGDAAGWKEDPFVAADFVPRLGAETQGKPWRWCDDRLYCRNLDDYVDLYMFFSASRPGSPAEPTERCVAYAHTWVWSPTASEVTLRIGANDGYRVWINGHVVLDQFSLARWSPRDQDSAAARLEAGWNRVLVKSLNGQGIWGFSFKLADQGGGALAGLEYSLDPPQGSLRVLTQELPAGYTRTPYCWLEILGVPAAEPRVPSASPLRLMAAGGVPPYRWSVEPTGHLPPGLYFDGSEGEILGVCGDGVGRYRVQVRVSDAVGATANAALSIEVRERPSRWLEAAKLGGLIHGAAGCQPPHGDPKLQAELMQRECYSWAAPTTIWHFAAAGPRGGLGIPGDPAAPGMSLAAAVRHQDMAAYVSAFRECGIRFGSYIGLPDHAAAFCENESTAARDWTVYLDALHRHFENLCVKYQPAVLYLDGATRLYRGRHDWNFDALYSLAKTLTPDCLLLPNLSDDLEMECRVGDADVVSIEGHNNSEAYWARWPRPAIGQNPKYYPVESWRYPFHWDSWKGRPEFEARRRPGEGNYVDPHQWCRVVVSMIAEGYLCNLDHTLGPACEDVHRQLGAWLEPRRESLIGTQPGPLDPAAWGYSVQRDCTIYLHLLANARGKTGWDGGPELTVAPLPGAVRAVHAVPGGARIPFQQLGDRLTLDMTAVPKDPVNTIVAIDWAP